MLNSKNVKKLALYLLFVSPYSLADSPQERTEVCERVEAARIEEQGKIAPPSLCEQTTRSKEYFVCVESKIKEGNKWSYAVAQCANVK